MYPTVQHIGKWRKTASCGSVIPISCWFTHYPYTMNCNSPHSFFFWTEQGESKFQQTFHTFLPPYGITPQKATLSTVTIVSTSHLDSVTSETLLLSNSIVLTLSDPTSDLVWHYDFPIPLRCWVTSDTFFFLRLFAHSAVGACPTLFLM